MNRVDSSEAAGTASCAMCHGREWDGCECRCGAVGGLLSAVMLVIVLLS